MKLAGLLVVSVVLSLPGRADAECGNPTWIGTPTATKIPQRGSLYVYNAQLGYYETDLLKAKGAIKQKTKVGETVIRMDYETQADELEIKLDDYSSAPVYNVDRWWRAPRLPPRVIQYWHHVYQWTCSFADSLMLQIDQPTAAFRALWRAPGKPVREWIIPARTDAGNVNVLELGKVDCGSTTIEPAELLAGGELTLIAIRFDGTEIAVAGLPAWISSKDLIKTSDGLDRAIQFEPGTEPLTPTPEIRKESDDGDFPWTIFVIVLSILGPLLYVRFTNRPLKGI